MKKTQAQARKAAVELVADKLKVTPRTARKYGLFENTSTTCNCGETGAVEFSTLMYKRKSVTIDDFETAIVGYCQKCGE